MRWRFPNRLIFLKPLFLAELGVSRAVKALAQGSHPLPAVNVDAAIAWAEKKMDIAFADSQRDAIREAVTQKLLVVTGGPGTGKTTIVRAIIEIFQAKSLRVLLCARPAGPRSGSPNRPAARRRRSTACWNSIPAIGTFRRGRENPLDADLARRRRNVDGRCRPDEPAPAGGAAVGVRRASSATSISFRRSGPVRC